jgi:hypothetical protein
MDRWAAAYFGPRVIHGKLRFDEYRSADVKRTQQQVLEHREVPASLHDSARP